MPNSVDDDCVPSAFMHGVGQFEFDVPLIHPCYAGHFPGHPIVPGVVCLDWIVAQYLASKHMAMTLQAVSHVKFLAPIYPGNRLLVQHEQKNQNTALTVFICKTEASTMEKACTALFTFTPV